MENLLFLGVPILKHIRVPVNFLENFMRKKCEKKRFSTDFVSKVVHALKFMVISMCEIFGNFKLSKGKIKKLQAKKGRVPKDREIWSFLTKQGRRV